MKSRRAGVAQLVEQLIRNQQVIGSSPIAGSSFNKSLIVVFVVRRVRAQTRPGKPRDVVAWRCRRRSLIRDTQVIAERDGTSRRIVADIEAADRCSHQLDRGVTDNGVSADD